MKKIPLWLSVAVMLASMPLRASGDELYDCYYDAGAGLDIRRDIEISLDDPADQKIHQYYILTLNLTKRQVNKPDLLSDGDTWLDAKVAIEGSKWIMTLPFRTFSETASETGIVYFNRNTHMFTALWRSYPEDPEFYNLLAVETGKCEGRNTP